MSSMHRHTRAPRTATHPLRRVIAPALSVALVALLAGPTGSVAAQATQDDPKPCPPGTIASGSGALRCAPADFTNPPRPAQDGPGTGDPGQGRDSTAQLVARDLALVETFRIGSAAMAWGTSASIAADSAAFKKNGMCGFRFLFRTRNAGGIPTPATSNRIHRDTATGAVLATRPLAALASGAVGVSDGHVLLKPGTWMLYAHADDPNAIAESNEANNLRRVKVTVTGACGGPTQVSS